MRLFDIEFVHYASDHNTRTAKVAATNFDKALEKAKKIANADWHNRVVSVTERLGEEVQVA